MIQANKLPVSFSSPLSRLSTHPHPPYPLHSKLVRLSLAWARGSSLSSNPSNATKIRTWHEGLEDVFWSREGGATSEDETDGSSDGDAEEHAPDIDDSYVELIVTAEVRSIVQSLSFISDWPIFASFTASLTARRARSLLTVPMSTVHRTSPDLPQSIHHAAPIDHARHDQTPGRLDRPTRPTARAQLWRLDIHWQARPGRKRVDGEVEGLAGRRDEPGVGGRLSHGEAHRAWGLKARRRTKTEGREAR